MPWPSASFPTRRGRRTRSSTSRMKMNGGSMRRSTISTTSRRATMATTTPTSTTGGTALKPTVMDPGE